MRNILLVCAAGMSTSMLVEKMKVAAASEGYECSISAHPVSKAQDLGGDADVILLGPQVRFELAKVQELFPDKPVEAIEMTDYGMMRGDKVIARVKVLLGD